MKSNEIKSNVRSTLEYDIMIDIFYNISDAEQRVMMQLLLECVVVYPVTEWKLTSNKKRQTYFFMNVVGYKNGKIKENLQYYYVQSLCVGAYSGYHIDIFTAVDEVITTENGM